MYSLKEQTFDIFKTKNIEIWYNFFLDAFDSVCQKIEFSS